MQIYGYIYIYTCNLFVPYFEASTLQKKAFFQSKQFFFWFQVFLPVFRMRRSIVATWCLHVFFRQCPELRKATFKRCELVHLWWYSATSYWCLWLGMCTLEPKENNNSINNSTSTTVVFLKGEAGCDIGDVGITVFVVGLNLRTSELPDIQRSRGRFLFKITGIKQ